MSNPEAILFANLMNSNKPNNNNSLYLLIFAMFCIMIHYRQDKPRENTKIQYIPYYKQIQQISETFSDKLNKTLNPY